ncbi:hypothetical protein Acr_02g0007460 [Actinidia rufa]|uniref:Proline-rich family protein n=1 Tax=Actinidia rufa TaxID=165716 RepID=A0A7J0E8L7_9ERIC|nr:hypothetical protein Acr_02g0007460 [Actinidia rufa]
MNPSSKEYLVGGRNIPSRMQHRRGLSLTGMSKDTDENLDLFSRNRRSLSVASSNESDVSVKLGRLSVGSTKLARIGMDDLLSSTDGGKHDYDWLLTPPGTPLFPSSDGSESQPPSAAPRSSSLVRSSSTTKASRCLTQRAIIQSRSIRSSSVTRPSISSSQYNTYSNRSTSILNTSSASISSYIRPSTPNSRSSMSSSTARPSTPSARPVTSRSSTPSKVRPTPTSLLLTELDHPKIQGPSTPSSRPQIQANLNTPTTRSASRPSTPTRRNSAPSSFPATTPLSPATGPSTSVGRVPSNVRNAATLSRPSSPSPRARPPAQPMILPDFSHETPPNLRTTLPDRPLSAGRSRPGVAVTTKGNTETPTPANVSRRQPSPVVSRGRLTEPPLRGRLQANGQAVDAMESRKASHFSELSTRKLLKTSATSTESSGFGRNISQKITGHGYQTYGMHAIPSSHYINLSSFISKCMGYAVCNFSDIKNGTGGIRPLSGTTLFPQSIRSANSKHQTNRALSAPASVNGNLLMYNNGAISEDGDYHIRSPENVTKDHYRLSAKVTDMDIYESSRYDAILLKEDLKNTNWLHSVDGKSDQGTHL